MSFVININYYATCNIIFCSLFFLPSLECVDRKYGKGTMVKYENDIKKKANQKCIDVLHKRMKLKSKENITPEE